MNNFDTGEKLLTEARVDLERVKEEYKRRRWNRVVRAAQEAVEHSLKGLLKMMGIEYPKVHDVGDIFEDACRGKGVDLEKEIFQEIREISASLADERSPAFYMERTYTQRKAQEAMRGAERVLEEAEEIARQLRGGGCVSCDGKKS